MKFINYCNRLIEYSFYSLFLLVPLVFTSKTSELFEFPKMWLTFVLTIIIVASWIAKMILQKRIHIQRTPLDIPLMLFLASQIISTIFSLDPHVSLWGYYSRFNGGLLSIIAYIVLYYALISNLSSKHIFKLLSISLFSGLIVALWGLPSHFGLDPTCYVFRGSFDTSCWTEAFKPTIRIFSTLGQPAWLAAYMSILIPISIAYFLTASKEQDSSSTKNQKLRIKNYGRKNNKLLTSYFLLLTSIFYLCLIYTNTRGGFIGFVVSMILFWAFIYIKKLLPRKSFFKIFAASTLLFILCNFAAGIPIGSLNKLTLPHLLAKPSPSTPQITEGFSGNTNITDSGKIRLQVWTGAINAWKEHKLTGTGVETYAYAYYKYKPKEHNLTSEWDYLYNKAHNEYLNYLTTTGVFGLGSYLAIIGLFVFHVCKLLNCPIAKLLKTNNKTIQQFNNSRYDLAKRQNKLLIIGLFSGWVSILVSNFFGFSVVITNLYFFLIPGFIFILGDFLNPEKAFVFPRQESRINLPAGEAGNQELRDKLNISLKQWALLITLIPASLFLILSLASYWNADSAYSKGSNLNKGGAYAEGYPLLINAVSAKPNEPVYKDELSLNMAIIAANLFQQKEATTAADLAQEAVYLNDEVVNNHPNNVVFWKNRVRLFYTLAQGNPENEKEYLSHALDSITKARALAPNDAKILYNLGVFYGQANDFKKGISVLEETIRLKPDYRDAYFALGLFYDELGERGKAVEALEHILKNIDQQDTQTKETLESWK